MSAATAAGASHADLRVHRITTEIIQLRDGELETVRRYPGVGLAVRVIVDGTWGFASHAELDAAGGGRHRTSCGARRHHAGGSQRRAQSSLRLNRCTPTPPGCRITESTRSSIGAPKRSLCCEEYSGRLLAADGVDHVSAGLTAVKEQTFYADTLGSSITQQRVRLLPVLEAVAVDAAAGDFDSMRTLAPPTARGWEVVAGDEMLGLDRRARAAPDAAGRESQVAQRGRRGARIW